MRLALDNEKTLNEVTLNEAALNETTRFLRQRLNGFEPEVLLALGSGLGFAADRLDAPVFVPYGEIPHFKASTAPGHKGRLAAGLLGGRRVLAMQGRLHVYEGYTAAETAFPVLAARALGAKTLVVTCACGGVNTAYQAGDLALLTDCINFSGINALAGFDASGFPSRFVDMSAAFDPSLREQANSAAATLGLALRAGVYFYMPGPTFETPAEIRAIRALGGDLVGMSAVHEVAMARRCGMRVLGLGLVSNMAAGVLNQPITETEVLDEAEKASARFFSLLERVLTGLNAR